MSLYYAIISTHHIIIIVMLFFRFVHEQLGDYDVLHHYSQNNCRVKDPVGIERDKCGQGLIAALHYIKIYRTNVYVYVMRYVCLKNNPGIGEIRG